MIQRRDGASVRLRAPRGRRLRRANDLGASPRRKEPEPWRSAAGFQCLLQRLKNSLAAAGPCDDLLFRPLKCRVARVQ